MYEDEADEIARSVGFAGGDNEVARFLLLKDEPHVIDASFGIAPVVLGVEVTEVVFLCVTLLDARAGAGGLARNEFEAAL